MEPEKIDVGWIDPEYVSGHFAHSMAEQLRDMEYFGCAGKVYRFTASQPIVARNSMVTKFLEGDSPWLWMVDADEVFDKGHAMKLWEVADEYEADMVSGLAMIWKEQNTPIPSVFFDDPDNEGRLIQYYNVLPDGPKRIAACGLASVLVHRRVFEAMSHPRHPEYRWFDFLPNEDIDIVGDEMTGIDVQFFVRARRLGFTLMLNPEARATSVEEIGVGYREWKTFWGQYSEEE